MRKKLRSLRVYHYVVYKFIACVMLATRHTPSNPARITREFDILYTMMRRNLNENLIGFQYGEHDEGRNVIYRFGREEMDRTMEIRFNEEMSVFKYILSPSMKHVDTRHIDRLGDAYYHRFDRDHLTPWINLMIIFWMIFYF